MIDIDTSREAVERLSADILRGNASTHRAAATLRATLLAPWLAPVLAGALFGLWVVR